MLTQKCTFLSRIVDNNFVSVVQFANLVSVLFFFCFNLVASFLSPDGKFSLSETVKSTAFRNCLVAIGGHKFTCMLQLLVSLNLMKYSRS